MNVTVETPQQQQQQHQTIISKPLLLWFELFKKVQKDLWAHDIQRGSIKYLHPNGSNSFLLYI